MQVKIVIPDDIYKKIKVEAEKNFRTITQEINYRLNKSLTSQQLYRIRKDEINNVTD